MKIAKYFSATWCGPCKAFKPVMNEVAGEGYMVEFLDVDNNSEMASKYGVRSVPTTIIEENGVEVNRFVGAIANEKPKKHLKKTRQGAGRGTKKSSVKPYRGQGGAKRRTR